MFVELIYIISSRASQVMNCSKLSLETTYIPTTHLEKPLKCFFRMVDMLFYTGLLMS